MNHECKYRDIYRLIRRYLMLNYPKIAQEVLRMTETKSSEDIKKLLKIITKKKYIEVYELSRKEVINV